EISVATIPVNAKDATSFGILKSDEGGNITSFIEKPNSSLLLDWVSEVSDEMKAAGREYLASMGIYVFNKEVLRQLLAESDGVDFGKELLPESIGRRRVHSYQYPGYWTDIGTIGSFFEANIGLTDDIPSFNLFDKHTIFTRPRMLPPSKVSGTRLDKVVVADGCIIAAEEIERSVIGVRSRIGAGTVIKTTYMMGCDFYQTLEEIEQSNQQGMPLAGVGENCYIENAIIDKNCCIGNNVRITGGSHLEDGDCKTQVVSDGSGVTEQRAVFP